jgi:hypothetical protein
MVCARSLAVAKSFPQGAPLNVTTEKKDGLAVSGKEPDRT